MRHSFWNPVDRQAAAFTAFCPAQTCEYRSLGRGEFGQEWTQSFRQEPRHLFYFRTVAREADCARACDALEGRCVGYTLKRRHAQRALHGGPAAYDCHGYSRLDQPRYWQPEKPDETTVTRARTGRCGWPASRQFYYSRQLGGTNRMLEAGTGEGHAPMADQDQPEGAAAEEEDCQAACEARWPDCAGYLYRGSWQRRRGRGQRPIPKEALICTLLGALHLERRIRPKNSGLMREGVREGSSDVAETVAWLAFSSDKSLRFVKQTVAKVPLYPRDFLVKGAAVAEEGECREACGAFGGRCQSFTVRRAPDLIVAECHLFKGPDFGLYTLASSQEQQPAV